MSARVATLAVLLLAAASLAGCAKDAKDNGSGATGSGGCDTLKATTFNLTYPGDAAALWDTTMGCIAVELYAEKTPITAGNFVNLTKSGFYDGTRFHRVIDGFMIQDGDPNTKDTSKKATWGQGGPGYSIVDEFPCKDGTVSTSNPAQCDTHGGLLFKHTGEGVLSMANTGRPKTGGSQYFITLAATAHLDGKHSIFGRVVGGIETVRAIGKTPTEPGDRPTTDVVITSLKLQ